MPDWQHRHTQQEQMISPRSHRKHVAWLSSSNKDLFFLFNMNPMLWLNWLAFYSYTILAFFFYAIIHSRIWFKMPIGTKATPTDTWEVNSFVDLVLCSQNLLSPLCFLSTHYASLWQMVMTAFDLNIDWRVQVGWGEKEGYKEQIFNLKKLCHKTHHNFQVKRTSSFSKWAF